MGSLKVISQIYSFVVWIFIAAVFLLLLYRFIRYYRNRNKYLSTLEIQDYPFSKTLKILFGLSMALILVTSPFYIYVASPIYSILPGYLNHLLFGIILVTIGQECFLSLKITRSFINKTHLKFLFTFVVVIILPLSITIAYYVPVLMSYPLVEESHIIELPVRGTWRAGHAGESEIVNYHSAARSQKYAMDIVKVDENGEFFKNGGTHIEDVFSMGEPIYSPVDGTVIHAVDSLPNSGITFEPSNSENPAGNHVVIQFEEERYLFLAHLDSASVDVQKGDTVSAGTPVGLTGNSGNTSWPHLHLHIQDKPLLDSENATAYPYRFERMKRKRWFWWQTVNKGYLLRNDLFEDAE